MSNSDNYETFSYIVPIQEGAEICFGSRVPRDTNPIGKGRSPFQKMLGPEIFPRIGPCYYRVEKLNGALHKVLHKVRSKSGVAPLSSKDPRFKDKITFRTPSPGRYNTYIDWGTDKKSCVPFGTSSKMKELECSTPSPATYDIRKIQKCRRTKFMHNFGCPKMIESVKTVCVTKPTDTCSKCEKLCEGDYWHINMTTFLCQFCWNEEKLTREIYDEKGLKQFKKIRNCSFMHSHEKTNAAIRILPQNKIVKKIRLENYLDLYLKC